MPIFIANILYWLQVQVSLSQHLKLSVDAGLVITNLLITRGIQRLTRRTDSERYDEEDGTIQCAIEVLSKDMMP